MRRVEIDEEVYAELGRRVRGFEQPNDVLRRELGLAEQPEQSSRNGSEAGMTAFIRGALLTLIEKGVVTAGDDLSHVQVRKGRTFSGKIESDGWIRTELDRYREPSPALGALVGTSIDGWKHWTHEPTGKSLRRLRHEIGGTGRGGR